MKKDYWRDPILWRDQLPREIRIHQLIDSNRADAIDDHDTLAEHHGYRLMMRQHRYRLYLTYYEGGDLYAALRGMPDAELKFLYTSPHKQRAKSPVNYHWDFNFNCYRDDDNDSLPRVVPERLICEIIDSLAKACQMLHFRQVDSEDAAEGTHRITHLDIKADNIFMQPSPEPDAFPKFVLSDYGLGFFAHDRNENMDDSSDNTAAPGLRAPPDNPDEYVFTFSTFDYRYAPEHHEQVQRMHPRPLGEKTDVWQIGAVFFWLLTNGFGRSIRGPKALYRGKLVYISNDVDIGKVGRTSGTDQFCDDTYPTLIRYNNKLRNLCARCLNWNPDHRPGLAEVRETTRAVLEANPRMRDDRDLAMLNVRRDDEARIGAILVGQEVEEL
jgi:serine/threonine protein kinase